MDDAVIGNGDGRVQRIVEATVVETRRPIGRGGAGFAPPFRIEPLREGMRCMAIGTDTDFPGDLDPIGEDEEPLSAVSITEISVVFAASSSIGTSTSDL